MFAKLLAWAVSAVCAIAGIALIDQGSPLGGIGILLMAAFAAPPANARLAESVRKDAAAKGRTATVVGPAGAAFFAFTMSAIIVAFSLDDSDPGGLAQAVPYRILENRDTSFPGRKRRLVHIVAEQPMASAKQRAHTVIQAARDIRGNTAAQAISVFLDINKHLVGTGNHWARAVYIPDGKGFSGRDKSRVWAVWAVQETPSPLEIRTRTLWERESDLFRNRETGELDENALKAHVIGELAIDENSFSLPYLHPVAFEFDDTR